MVPTARNSDCQFCSVRAQKSGLTRYSPQPMGAWSCWSRVSLKAASPATDWMSHEAKKMRGHHQDQRVGVERRTPTARPCPRRGVGLGVAAELLVLIDSRPSLSIALDSGDPRCTS